MAIDLLFQVKNIQGILNHSTVNFKHSHVRRHRNVFLQISEKFRTRKCLLGKKMCCSWISVFGISASCIRLHGIIHDA